MKIGLGVRAVSLVSLAAFAPACSTSYMPVAGPRASIVLDNGKQAIARDGHVYPVGGFGGGLEDAVAGNPRAEEHARTFNTDLTVGFACTMLSLAGFLGGSTLTTLDATENRQVSAPGLGLIGAGLVLYVVGLAYLASAPPHFYDAINIYNDGLEHARADPSRAR
jgi:hypothetical protein